MTNDDDRAPLPRGFCVRRHHLTILSYLFVFSNSRELERKEMGGEVLVFYHDYFTDKVIISADCGDLDFGL